MPLIILWPGKKKSNEEEIAEEEKTETSLASRPPWYNLSISYSEI